MPELRAYDSPAAAGVFCVEKGCELCPRRCGAARQAPGSYGFCASPGELRIARAAAHFGEEPCVSGTRGSGAVFFTGCNLRCRFCQNHRIARGEGGFPVSTEGFRAILYRLEDQGVHNINLVTGSHYSRRIAEALAGMRLSIPVVWNSSAYESVPQLKELEGLVQIYLPDLKYADAALAGALSAAPDYPSVALAAIREMHRQTGPAVTGPDGLLQKGVLLRHLILPGYVENTLRVLDTVEDELPHREMLFSLLAQYTPVQALVQDGTLDAFPSLQRTLTPEEYRRVLDYLDFSSIEEGYVQELGAAGEDAIPAFDGTGVIPVTPRP